VSKQYQEDVRQAALSGSGFDKANSKEIGDTHGEDPKTVLKDIKALRSQLADGKTKAESLLDKLNTEPGEDFHEMANLPKQDTGVPFTIHIRTRAATPGHPGTPSLKVYSGRPFSSDSFTVSIGEAPEVVAGKDGEFCRSVSSRDMRKVASWVSENRSKLVDFYFNGMSWSVHEISDWAKTLVKV
jgi:hypothetical protein